MSNEFRSARTALSILALLLGLAVSASALAASAGIKATYFNDQVQFSVLGSGSSGVFFDPATSVQVTVDGIVDSASAAAFFDPLTAEVVEADASGSAITLINMTSTATLFQPGGSAFAFSSRSGRMTFSGTGILVVSAPFSIEREVLGGGIPDASGIAGVGISALRFERGDISYASDSFMLLTDAGPDVRTGLLAIAVPFEDGETILFSATVSASASAPAPVPLPAALPLFGTALGMIGIHRRRKLSRAITSA